MMIIIIIIIIITIIITIIIVIIIIITSLPQLHRAGQLPQQRLFRAKLPERVRRPL